jgi:indolepyruvate ferredoxin oxidoreductase beta subunit
VNYDVYLVGVGGQGVLAVGDIISRGALEEAIPVSYYPTKGMVQRGGFVRAQVRLRREPIGPIIPKKRADLAIAMERSEALKAVPYVRPGGDFIIFTHAWLPSAVALGTADYPTLEQVTDQVQQADARLHVLSPDDLPFHDGVPVAANLFVLGYVFGHTLLGAVLEARRVKRIVEAQWERAAEQNALAFEAGMRMGSNGT